MVLVDGSRWAFLSTGPKELWETGDKVAVSDAGSQKVKTLYIVKNITKNEAFHALFLGTRDIVSGLG